MHVVTGATGHIGANLVRALAQAGTPVRALARTPPPAGLFEGLPVDYRAMDLAQPASIAPAIEGASVLYHLAGLISITGDQGGLVHTINVQGTRHVAQAALDQGVQRLVYTSSVQAFDVFADTPEVTEQSPRPTASAPAYDRSKADSEEVLAELVSQGLDAVTVYPTGVLGPMDHRPSRFGQGVKDIWEGRVPALLAGHTNVVDVRDVVQGIMAAAAHGQTGHGYLLSGHPISIPKLMQMAAEISGTHCPSLICPMWLARLSAPLAVAWAHMVGAEPLYTHEALRALRANNQISHAKATHELGYQPRPLQETLRDLHHSFYTESTDVDAATRPPTARQ